MFRVVREFVPMPHFMVLCDHGACGSFNSRAVNFDGRIVEIATDNTADIVTKDRKAFLDECVQNGWLIDIGTQLCPAHFEAVKKMLQPSVDDATAPPAAPAAVN